MASEDIFEDFSEEIIMELDQENTNDAQDDTELEEETEDMNGVLSEMPNNNNTEESTKDTDETESTKTTAQLANGTTEPKLFKLPLARIRNLMKLDPDLHIASNEAVFLVTRATELFIESMARESYTYTAQARKKTVQKRDVDLAIAGIDSLMFLEGAMNF